MKLLLVEDEPAYARLIREMLKEALAESFQVQHVDRLEAALECVRQEVFDIVLLDLGLPDSYGMMTLMRAQEASRSLPIIVLTGLDDERFALEVMRAGAQDYLFKGRFDGEQLLRTIRHAVERKRAEEEIRRLNADLELRVAERTAQLQTANDQLLKEITERKQKEEDLRKLNRVLTAIGKSDRALMLAVEEPAYLREVCQIIIKDCGHPMVWIGYTQNDVAKEIQPVACAGLEETLLKELLKGAASQEEISDPTFTAIRTQKVCRSNVIVDPKLAPRPNQGRQCEYASALALPLLADGKVFGALTIYSWLPNAFQDEEENLLGQLADDLAYGVSALRLRAAHALAEEALRESEERFHRMFEHHKAIMLVIDPESGHIVDANRAAAAFYGLLCEQLCQMRIEEFNQLPPEEVAAELQSAAEDQRKYFVFPHRLANGQICWVEVYSTPIIVGGRSLLFSVIHDITERKRAEEERDVTVEFLRLVNSSTETRGLIQAVSGFFQQQSGCEAVGVRLKEGDDYPYYLTCGFPKEFVLAENRLCQLDEAGRIYRDSAGEPVLECLCGNVICGRINPEKPFFTPHGSFWTNNTTDLVASTSETERQARTRNRCHGEGYDSVALIPLRFGEERIGLLQLNDRRKGLFTLESISLWERLADLLAVALSKFRAEEALRKNQDRLKLALKSANMGIFEWDILKDVRSWDDHVHTLLGTNSKAFEGTAREFFEAIHPEDRANVQAALDKALKSDLNYETDYRVIWPDGSVHHLAARGKIKTDTKAQPVYMLGVCWDITELKQYEKALRQSEQLFLTMANAMPQLAWIAQPDGYIPWYNQRWYDYTGTTPEQMEGWGWQSVHDPQALPQVMKRWTDSLATGQPFEMEFPLRGADGSFRQFLTRGIPQKNAEGQVVQWFGTNTDITESKHREEELRRLNRVLTVMSKSNNSMMHATSESMYLHQVCQTVVQDCGHAMVWIGYAAQDEAKSVRPVAWAGFEADYLSSLQLTWADEERGRGPMGTAIRTGKLSGCRDIDTDVRFRPWRDQARQRGYASCLVLPLSADGNVFGALAIYSQQIDAFSGKEEELLAQLAGDLAYGISALRVRAERAQAEAALRESEARYRAIGESIDYGVWICAPDGRNIYTSESFLKLVGLTQEQCSNMGWGDVLHPEDAERSMAAWKECVSTGGTLDVEQRFRGVDGHWHPILVRGVPIRNEHGQITSWAGINIDISRLKQVEDNLKASVLEKEVMLKEIHHRVKNNLQVISSLVDLQAAGLDSTVGAVFADVRNRVRSMALVHEKLYQSENLAYVDFGGYTRSLLNYLWRAHVSPAANIRLKLDLQSVSFPVDTAVPCGLILNELASNALKHAFRDRPDGEIFVAMHTDADGRVQVRVRDNGVGLPPGLDWRQSRSMGLRLIQMLTKQLNGRIEVDQSHGTDFLLTLPLKPTHKSSITLNPS